MQAELQAVREMVATAELSSEGQRIATWSVEQLPKLYVEFVKAYDSRYADDILRWVETLLKALQEEAAVADNVREHLVNMHERLGLPHLAFKKPAAKPARRKKTA